MSGCSGGKDCINSNAAGRRLLQGACLVWAQQVEQVLQVAHQRSSQLHGARTLGRRRRHRAQHVHERKQQLPVQPPQLPAKVCSQERGSSPLLVSTRVHFELEAEAKCKRSNSQHLIKFTVLIQRPAVLA